jgi:hypothetical protein
MKNRLRRRMQLLQLEQVPHLLLLSLQVAVLSE